MHVIVVGCGRVGSTVARELVEEGHDVVVIDRHAASFARLGTEFNGRVMTGVGFDREVLMSAGITSDSAVMAVTSGDNSNILIARVARETFGVDRVVARIYDPKRAAVYARLGIPTVATVAWTAGQVKRTVMPHETEIDWSDPTSTHVMVERRVPAAAAGTAVSEFDAAGLRIAVLTRSGHAQLPRPELLVQEDDRIHVVVASDHIGDLDARLAGHARGSH